ncbi:ABC transporter ATP-binding protein [Schumannella luteola]|uniref:ABC-type multidrug transport system fused ATPase/permease subunit n=1 Tax=Schumannella luteola TaxID=472059 RepID=A0A852YDI5_9MICO|nr:ABC transporter ATP-binding protein [Schumannella luteola]NYG97707.1 ABC-type multidrug transport system fused ATPase/permease subunit [Schumannella luteola]
MAAEESADESKVAVGGRSGLRDLWPFVASHRLALGFGALLSLASAGLSVAQPLMVQRLVDAVSRSQPLVWLVVALVAVTLGEAIATAVRSWVLQRTGERVVFGIRKALIDKVFSMPIAVHDRRSAGDTASRLTGDTAVIRSMVTAGLFELASSAVMFIGAVVLMILMDPLLFGIILIAIAVGATGVLVAGRRLRQLSFGAQTSLGSLTADVVRGISGIRTIRASNAGDREAGRVIAQASGVLDAGLRIARLASLIRPLMSLCIQGAFVIVLAVGGARVADGSMTLGNLVAFILYLFLLIQPISQASGVFTEYQAAMASLDRVKGVLAIPSEASGGEKPTASWEIETGTNVPLLEFDDVVFSYGEVPVLDRVSFAVRRGSRSAIVGPSGAGKSTVLALLERFYEPDSGEIRIDGEALRGLDRDAIRARIGFVEQDSPALAGTLADNLRLGANHATDDQLLDTLERVGLSSLVPQGARDLDRDVGDSGVMLSGGQRQRIAWARMLLKDPEILLLDEPTSSVDARTEAALQRLLDEESRHRTVVVVAHRLATISKSDQIIVVDGGRVVAVGDHATLLDSSEIYADYAAKQALAV